MKQNPHRRLTVVGAAVVVAMAIPFAAQAVTPTFSDVGVSHPFFDEIEWMADTNISTGYDDGTYRPSEPVTRQAMSAFMQRVYDLQDDMSWITIANLSSTSSSTWSDLSGSVTVNVPDGVYANIAATFTGESACYGGSPYCRVRLMVSEDGGPYVEMYGGDSGFAFDSTSGAAESSGSWESHAMQRFSFGDPGSSYNIKAQISVSAAGTTFNIDDYTLMAETDLQPSDYIPF